MNTRVLIADDEKAICELLKNDFDPFVYSVDLANDGEEAIRKYNRQAYDVVVLDVNMPRKTGLDVLRHIKAEKKDTIVVMMTAFGSIDGAVQCMKLNADDYITKPFFPESLVEKVTQLLTLQSKFRQIPERGGELSPVLYGSSAPVRELRRMIDKVKNAGSTVLLTGESGTGKGVVARILHYTSEHAEKPFVHVDCASLPENLIESELFGYEKGAFTGANNTKQGKFELARDGTVFLDEISTLTPALQSRLLVVLQDRTFEHVGGVRKIPMKGRIIAATNENLEESIKRGKFRADLYYRLNIVCLEMPPLRAHREDIRELADAFIAQHQRTIGIRVDTVDDDVWVALMQYDWPGNVRELQNVLESAMVLSDDHRLSLKNLPDRVARAVQGAAPAAHVLSLEGQEIRTIVAALEKHNGHREKTARELGISRRALQYKLAKYHLIE